MSRNVTVERLPIKSDPDAASRNEDRTYVYQACGACGREVQIPVEHRGKLVVCLHCRCSFRSADPTDVAEVHPQDESLVDQMNRLLDGVETDGQPVDLVHLQPTHVPVIESQSSKDAELHQRVEQFLRSRGIEGLEEVQVDVLGNVVYLTGRVPSSRARALCTSCSRRVAGVMHVINALEATHSAHASGQ